MNVDFKILRERDGELDVEFEFDAEFEALYKKKTKSKRITKKGLQGFITKLFFVVYKEKKLRD